MKKILVLFIILLYNVQLFGVSTELRLFYVESVVSPYDLGGVFSIGKFVYYEFIKEVDLKEVLKVYKGEIDKLLSDIQYTCFESVVK
jgi:hypothetical protein